MYLSQCSKRIGTVFPRMDAVATIYFIAGIGVAFIRGWRLFLSAHNIGVATPSIAVLEDCSIAVLEDC